MYSNIDIQILRAIHARAVPTGATALTGQLHIPQATIGRVMNQLEQEGYLQKVSNKGRILSDRGIAYLKSASERQNREEAADSLIRSSSSLSLDRLIEILEIREDLERRSARLACRNATDSELESLNGIMLEYLYDINNGGDGSSQDLKFHLTLARYSQNKTLHQLLTLLLTTHHAYADFAFHSESFLIKQAEGHHTIIQALIERDPDKAADAMAKHLDNLLFSLREKAAANGTQPENSPE